MAAQQFDWEGRQARRRQRNGSKVIGLGGPGLQCRRSGMDGIVTMGTDGRLKIHNGVGNWEPTPMPRLHVRRRSSENAVGKLRHSQCH